MLDVIDESLLLPGPIRQVRLDLTSRCNLRCVYCAVSHPDYVGVDMSDDTARSMVRLILDLARYNELDPVDLNGHGETTIRPDWAAISLSLVEHGIRVRITSNFAKSFDEEELQALACMDTIAISIDTADQSQLRRIRRHVDLRQIVTNMVHVRAAAVMQHRLPPKFDFLCGLYDANTLDWESFARFAIGAGVGQIGLWSLTEHPGQNMPDADRVRPLDALADDELKPRLQSVLRGLRILRRHDVAVNVQGDFLSRLVRRVGLDVNG